MTGQERASRLFLVLAVFFVGNALLAELIGVKIFALEETLGLAPFEWNLFGQSGSLNFTAGTLLWPIVFVMTDIINEFYGKRGVRFISWLAVIVIVYGFVFAYLAISLAPASWWVSCATRGRASSGARSRWCLRGPSICVCNGRESYRSRCAACKCAWCTTAWRRRRRA